MSKYENEQFANMKISIFLIIGFTHFVLCSNQNITDVCQVRNNFFRQKRALIEYTRWRANVASTPEFIVKILDEDPPTPKPKKIVAVNIQPITKGVEKIIIGGAMVTMPESKPIEPSSILEILKEYTRFVPPTTVATRVEGDFYLAPVQPYEPPVLGKKDIMPILPRARNPQRDESPPASPQFLPRSQAAGPRQYAPIAPVGFTVQTNIAPLTPPSGTDAYGRKSNLQALRTTPFGDIQIPKRTKSDMEEFGNLIPFHEASEENDARRTTYVPQFEPKRTIKVYQATATADFDFMPTTEKSDDHYKANDRDSDAAYGTLFYNYDDEVGETRKSGKGLNEGYDDKLNEQEELQIKETDVLNVSDKLEKVSTHVPRAKIELTDEVQDNDEIREKSETPSSTQTAASTTTEVVNTVFDDITTNKNMKDTLRDKRRQSCSMISLRELNFNSPRTLPEIESKLKQWAENSPVAKWVDITDGNFTTMERPIYMMIVDDPSSGQIISAKQTVMIVAGIQGRDHHAVAAAMYVLFQLIERSTAHADLLTRYRFWIIPVFNPDGYDYAMTFPHRREWVKNLRQNWDVCKGREACRSCEEYGLRCTIQPCYGVNLDRNFEYQWIPAEELRTEHPCGSLYAGKRQLSEAETSAFTKFLHNQHSPLFTFIAFKEGDVLGVMYPYSHTKKKRAFEHTFKQRASRAAAAAYSISGRPYVAGQTSEFLPLYAGGIEDWVDGHLGVDNTYTIMMFRPADTYNSKLITERVVHEAYAAMDTLVLQTNEMPAEAGIAPVTLTGAKVSSATHSAPHNAILLAFITVGHTCFT